MSIPRIIHQTHWDPRTKPLPETWIKAQNTWIHHHPHWKHMVWLDKDNEQFLRKHYPWFYLYFWNIPMIYRELMQYGHFCCITGADCTWIWILCVHALLMIPLDMRVCTLPKAPQGYAPTHSWLLHPDIHFGCESFTR